ncbi:MAG: hypothetical protein HRT83_05060 [Hyphomicrobiaceae bacterium]|nr:hypothetical protein [Hyphomicrobiaceae bacterium]
MLFRDQAFVGKGHISQLAGGEDLELGFGADKVERVIYSKTSELRST